MGLWPRHKSIVAEGNCGPHHTSRDFEASREAVLTTPSSALSSDLFTPSHETPTTPQEGLSECECSEQSQQT